MLYWRTHIELSLSLQLLQNYFYYDLLLVYRFITGYDVLIQVTVIFAFIMSFYYPILFFIIAFFEWSIFVTRYDVRLIIFPRPAIVNDVFSVFYFFEVNNNNSTDMPWNVTADILF